MQTEELISYSKSHNYEIYEKYIDFGFSGSTIERPALTNLFEDAKAQRFNIVLVTKIDRFERSILDCLLNIKNLQEYGIQFAATSQPIDTSSSMGKLTPNIMAAFADFEREIIRERMKFGRKAAEKRGVICNRPRKEFSKKAVLNYIETGLSATTAAKLLKVNPATIVKRLNEWGYVYENGRPLKKEKCEPYKTEDIRSA